MTDRADPAPRFAGKASDARSSARDLCRRSEQGRVVPGRGNCGRAYACRGSVRAARASAAPMAGQNGVFANASPAKRPASRAAKNLTNAELGKVQDLQGETSKYYELVERAVLPQLKPEHPALPQSYGGGDLCRGACRRWCRGLKLDRSLTAGSSSVRGIRRGGRGRGRAPGGADQRASGELEATPGCAGSAIEQRFRQRLLRSFPCLALLCPI